MMEATSLRRLSVLPSLSSSPAAASRRLGAAPHSLHRRPPLCVQALRIFAAATDSEGEVERAGPSSSSSSFSGLSAEELEQKLGKRSRARKETSTKASEPPKPASKDWESMTIAEKAWDLYISEKGALFWLNKIAYAAIFVLVGGWIAFRFVGPALNLYQLESPLLPADQVFSGSK